MNDLSNGLKKSIFENIHARPRYGILQFTGQDKPPSNVQIGGYGRSFVVLKDIAKLNCLFSAGDTFKRDNDNPWKICTLHHSEILLLECAEVMLKAIIFAVLNNKVPDTDFRGYFEAQMCGFNLLDPNIVAHIHVDKYEHELEQSDIERIKTMKISITNDYGEMYKKLWNEKYQAFQDNDKENKQNVFSIPRF